MHRVFFGIKRAHLCVLALTRPYLVGAGLTPARFDLLRVVSAEPEGVRQSTLVDLLGVARSVVSRMLKAMQLLGLIVRRRDTRDRRCLIVHITAVGDDSMERAERETLDSNVAERLASRGVSGDRIAKPEAPEIQARVKAFEDQIARMRALYNDQCPVRDPWRRGELVPMIFTKLVDGRLFYDDSAWKERPQSVESTAARY